MPSYVITGASRGIGLEFVRQLSTVTDNIVFALVRNRAAESLRELASQRENVHVLEADVMDVPAVEAAAKKVSETTRGSLDVLINNAALLPDPIDNSGLAAYTGAEERRLDEDLRKVIDVNVLGVIHVTNAFLPLLREGSVKKVVTISSGLGDLQLTLRLGFPFSAPYCISKAALNMVVAKYAMELREAGIAFLAISPGVVDTATRPPTKEEKEQSATVTRFIQKVRPGYQGAMKPETSVQMMLGVVEKFTIADTGAFMSNEGNFYVR